jgi:hypothetical protein
MERLSPAFSFYGREARDEKGAMAKAMKLISARCQNLVKPEPDYPDS